MRTGLHPRFFLALHCSLQSKFRIDLHFRALVVVWTHDRPAAAVFEVGLKRGSNRQSHHDASRDTEEND
jgi:hypothetical protein